MYCKKVEDNSYGFRMNIHIFYNQAKTVANAAEFYDKLKAMENDLKTMAQVPAKNSSYLDYFDITKEDNTEYVKYTRKNDEIKKALRRCGFFVIAETVFSKSSEEILDLYGERDTIEKCFNDLKNELDFDRLQCSNNEILKGKMFAAFISLVFLSQIRKPLKNYMEKKKYTFKKILIELDKIKIIYDSKKPEKYRLLNPLTKTQNDIIKNLGMAEDILLNLI